MYGGDECVVVSAKVGKEAKDKLEKSRFCGQ